MRLKKFVLNLCLSLAATLLCLVFLEIVLKSYNVIERFFRVPLCIVIDSPILYGLNPEHSGISSQGLLNDEVVIPKPKGTFRLLILGDSVAFGENVSRNKTFPNRLQELLRNQIKSVDVINAGVPGYSSYNELQYYLTRGRKFEADIVIVAFCMNDVVNPRLHWRNTNYKIINIPKEAIPNPDYDLKHVLPIIQKSKQTQPSSLKKLLYYSELYNILKPRVNSLFQKKNEYKKIKEVPTYLTLEDKQLSIQVLLDKTSPEWQWLTSIYDQLNNAVKKDQAKLIIVIFPLAYQLDMNYPFFPQNNITQYCQQNNILCINLLPSFRQHPKEDMFLLSNYNYYYDIWHLTAYGNKLSAQEILHFLKENKLLQGKTKKE